MWITTCGGISKSKKIELDVYGDGVILTMNFLHKNAYKYITLYISDHVFPITVISSLNEPVAGWVDNYNGPTGIIAAAGKGFFRTMLCHENKVADLVPVDIVINLMICAAWKTGTKYKNNNG